MFDLEKCDLCGDCLVLCPYIDCDRNEAVGQFGHPMTRPVGRPSKKPKVFFRSFSYRAASWDMPRRVVAKVEWHAGELFPRVGFIVTNMSSSPQSVVHFYNKVPSGVGCRRWRRNMGNTGEVWGLEEARGGCQ